MTMKLGQSTVIMGPSYHSPHSVVKKISNYIFRFEDKIGQGNFSKVYKGYHQLSNEQVAIKIIQLSSVKSSKLQQLLFSQIEVIQSLNHPNILKCYQVLKSQHNCYIITQLCNGGDLQSVLKKYICLNETQAAPYIRDIYKGLIYLGQRGIVHRDLKIANVFIHNGTAKIADFGFAKYTQNHNFKDLDIGSPLYMSPEGMIDHIYGMKTDIWAFGVIIYQLLHGQTIFCNCKTQYDLKRAVSIPISYNVFRPDLNPEIRQLVFKCLIVNFENRPDALSLVNDQYLSRLLNMERNIHYFSQKSINHSPSINQIFCEQNIKSQQKIKNYEQQCNNYQAYKHEKRSFHNLPNSQQNQYLKMNNVAQLNPQFYSYQNLQNSNHSPYRPLNTQKQLFKPQQNQVSGKIISHQPNINVHNVQKNDNFQFYGSVKNDNRKPINGQNNQNNQDDFLSPNRPNRNRPYLETPGSPEQRINSSSIDQNKSDKVSLLCFSHHNVSKKVQKNNTSHNLSSNITKSVSSNNLGVKMNQNKNSATNSLNQSNNNLYSSFHSNNSDSIKDNSIAQSISVRKVLKHHTMIESQNHNTNNNKKFGEIIKGDKTKQLGPVKLITKFDKIQNNKNQNEVERFKSKSNLGYDNQYQNSNQAYQVNLIDQKHSARLNYDQGQQKQISLPKQIPNFLQQKIKQNIYTNKRNVISTVIQFKEAVGILHYCRLIYRFIITLKKIQAFPHFKDLNFKSLENPQTSDIFSRYLLTVLNELVSDVKSKQIIYDGENYKKKQSQQEKLKQVTEEYYRKYYQDINKNRDPLKIIIPLIDKSTSIEWMKQFCQQIWQCLDNQSIIFKQRIQRGLQSNQNFIKNFQNICYLSVKIALANQMLSNSARTKNYTSISIALIQNWITQDFYKQSDYINAKNQYLAMLNQNNPLKMSQTNDTQDNNGRLDYI